MNEVKTKGNGSISPASVNCGPWQSTDTQTNSIGEIFRQVEVSGNWVTEAGRRQICVQLKKPQGVKAVQEFELELKTSTRAIVNFQKVRSVVQSPKSLRRRDRIQVLRGVVK